MHITASVFINEDESGLHHDYEVWLRRWHRASGMALRRHEAVWLEKLAPHEPVGQYQHNRTGEDNADAHMKRQVTPALALRASAVQVWGARWSWR